MLTGIYTIGSGKFILDGKEIRVKNQVEANNEGIAIIVQELGTLSGLTVAENIFLGHEDRFVKFGIKNTNAMVKEANELLKKYGFDRINAADMIDLYNFEDRKLIEIVKSTYFNPKIVVIDETTTALSQEGREELYKHMERIKKEGNTVIFISHDLPEVLDKCDRVSVLRDGVYIDTVNAADVSEDDLKKLGSMVKTYLTNGGKHVQFNVVDRATLVAAQEHPEEHQDLVVRVSGFSAYFTTLMKTTQDEIIARSEYANM